MLVYATMGRKNNNIYYYYFYDYEKEKLIQFEKEREKGIRHGKEMLFLVEHCMKECLRRGIEELIIISSLGVFEKYLSNLDKIDKLDKTQKSKFQKISHLKERFKLFQYKNEINKKKKQKNTKEKIAEDIKLMIPNGFEAVAYSDISSVQDSKRSSIAAILYDINGHEIENIAEEVEFKANTTALESEALLQIMRRTKEKSLKKVLFRTDCQSICVYLTNVHKYRKKRPPTIIEIIDLLKQHPNWKVEKVNRKHNKNADKLARKVLNLN